MVSILGANSVSGGYEVENSLRFNDGDSPRLTRTPSSAGNRRTFTLSVWLKLTVSPSGDSNFERQILAADDGTGGNNNFDYISINNSDKIFIYNYEGGEAYVFTSTQLLRDPSAWYHLVVAFDTTQGTNTNRVKIYLNGSQITAFDTASYPSQNHQTRFNNNNAHRIGSYPDHDSQYFDGYMCEYHLVDGSQLAPTSFGEFDDNGVWVPIEYTGSHGTNGFYLEFKQTGTSQNSSGIGADTSGNDNHWAVTNLAATDVNVDTCTNNWCTLNPLDTPTSGSTFSEGNLKIDTSSGQQGFTRSTIAVSQGKWYFETKITTGNVREAVGIALTEATLTDTTKAVHYYSRYGHVLKGNSLFSTKATFGDNDKIGVAFNLDDNTVAFYKNGSLQDTVTSIDSGTYSPIFRDGSDAYTGGGVLNFGNNGTFAGTETAQGNSDGNGYGDFYYSVPSGYYALNTKNLAEFG